MTPQLEVDPEHDPDDMETVTLPVSLYAALIRSALFARNVIAMARENDALSSLTIYRVAEHSELVFSREFTEDEIAAMDPVPADNQRPIFDIEIAPGFGAALQFLDDARDVAMDAASEAEPEAVA